MTENPLDEYCDKIFQLLIVTYQSYRFNELHRTLNHDFHFKISMPTLVQHLNHLQKKGFIKRTRHNKQNISYRVNWEKFQALKQGLKFSPVEQNLENEKTFKSLSLNKQIVTLASIFTLGNLLYLKLYVLDILEPNKKPEHRFTYIFMNKWLDMFRLWLLDSCKESKETSQKALGMIEAAIDGFPNELSPKKL